VTVGKFRGTHLDKFQGLPATGKSIEIEVMHIDTLVDGKIVSHWGQGNQAGMMKQLGIAFIPGFSLITSIIRHQWQK
jgi:predicted ester cyclase